GRPAWAGREEVLRPDRARRAAERAHRPAGQEAARGADDPLAHFFQEAEQAARVLPPGVVAAGVVAACVVAHLETSQSALEVREPWERRARRRCLFDTGAVVGRRRLLTLQQHRVARAKLVEPFRPLVLELFLEVPAALDVRDQVGTQLV